MSLTYHTIFKFHYSQDLHTRGGWGSTWPTPIGQYIAKTLNGAMVTSSSLSADLLLVLGGTTCTMFVCVISTCDNSPTGSGTRCWCNAWNQAHVYFTRNHSKCSKFGFSARHRGSEFSHSGSNHDDSTWEWVRNQLSFQRLKDMASWDCNSGVNSICACTQFQIRPDFTTSRHVSQASQNFFWRRPIQCVWCVLTPPSNWQLHATPLLLCNSRCQLGDHDRLGIRLTRHVY